MLTQNTQKFMQRIDSVLQFKKMLYCEQFDNILNSKKLTFSRQIDEMLATKQNDLILNFIRQIENIKKFQQSDFIQNINKQLKVIQKKKHSHFAQNIIQKYDKKYLNSSESTQNLIAHISKVHDLTAQVSESLSQNIQNKNISADDLKQVESIFDSDVFKSESISDQLSYLIEQVKKQNSTSAIIRGIILGMLLNIICNWITQIWEVPKRAVDILRNTRSTASKMHLDTKQGTHIRVCIKYRILLHVRPSRRANIIGSIRMGEVVTVTRKRGKWCLIATSERKNGWVRCKYVKRITKTSSYSHLVFPQSHERLAH